MRYGLHAETIWFLLGVAGLYVLLFFALIYIAYFRLREILGFLNNSPSVYGKAAALGFSPIGRIMFLGKVRVMLTLPGRSIKIGALDVKDYERFPLRFKAFIRFCCCGAWLQAGGLVLFWLVTS